MPDAASSRRDGFIDRRGTLDPMVDTQDPVGKPRTLRLPRRIRARFAAAELGSLSADYLAGDLRADEWVGELLAALLATSRRHHPGDNAHLRALGALGHIGAAVRQHSNGLAHAARADGTPWTVIADLLGMAIRAAYDDANTTPDNNVARPHTAGQYHQSDDRDGGDLAAIDANPYRYGSTQVATDAGAARRRDRQHRC